MLISDSSVSPTVQLVAFIQQVITEQLECADSLLAYLILLSQSAYSYWVGTNKKNMYMNIYEMVISAKLRKVVVEDRSRNDGAGVELH